VTVARFTGSGVAWMAAEIAAWVVNWLAVESSDWREASQPASGGEANATMTINRTNTATNNPRRTSSRVRGTGGFFSCAAIPLLNHEMRKLAQLSQNCYAPQPAQTRAVIMAIAERVFYTRK